MRSILLDVAQLVAHLVRDQEVAGSSPVIQTIGKSSTYGVSQVLDLFLKGEKVYYYSVCGQMKVFLDRMNPLYGKMKDKDFYYMVTAQDDDKKQLERAFDVFDGFADCFEDIRRCGRIYGGGADKKGEVKDLPAFSEAYELGKKI